METEPRGSRGKPVYSQIEIDAAIDQIKQQFPDAEARIWRLPTGEYRVEIDLSGEKLQPVRSDLVSG